MIIIAAIGVRALDDGIAKKGFEELYPSTFGCAIAEIEERFQESQYIYPTSPPTVQGRSN